MNSSSPWKTMFLFCVLLWAILSQAQAQKNLKNETETNCDFQKVDRCAAKIFLVGYAKFPKNLDENRKYCKSIKSQEQCLKNFAQNCLEPQSKQTISIITYSLSRTAKTYCSTNRRQNQFIRLGQCINENFKKTTEIWHDWIKSYLSIPTYKDAKLHLPMMCCSLYHYKQRALDELCSDPAQLETFANILDSLSADTLNFICSEYNNDSDKCDGVVEKIPKWNKPLVYKSFMIPLMKILDIL